MLAGRADVYWVDAKVVSTSSTLSTEVSLGDANIVVGDLPEWPVLPVPGEKRICNYFDECMVSFHEWLFRRVKL